MRHPADALAELLRRSVPVSGVETVETRSALGRVLDADVVARETLPGFDRATMDGFAVRAAETYGASDASPAYLRFEGEVAMGARAEAPLGLGGAIRVHTGAMLPPGADAVVMVEDTSLVGSDVEIVRAAAPGENTLAAGEDVRAGARAVVAGRALRAHDLGGLHALGIVTVAVRRKPVVAVLSTGDELLAPGALAPAPGRVRDANTVVLCATIEAAGGIARAVGIAPDDLPSLERAMRAALEEADALVLSAGSSVSVRDLTAAAVDRLGPPGVFVHGIALRPGKPTVLGFAGSKPVVGLPGNPVSAAVVARRLVAPLVRRLAGIEATSGDELAGTVAATLTTSVPSRPGREDYVPCTLAARDDGRLVATPRFGSSNLIFTLVRADGLIVVPFDEAGLVAGATARVAIL